MRLLENFTAGEAKRFHIAGQFFVFDSVPGGSVDAIFYRDGRRLYEELTGVIGGWSVAPGGGFDSVEVTSSLTQAVSFYVARGPLRSSAVAVINFPLVQVVSGTVTADQGAAGAADWRTDQRRGQAGLFVPVDVAGAGDNIIVAADATKKIKVSGYVLIADAAVAARWKSGAAGNLSGAMSLAANGGAVAPHVAPAAGHWLETAINAALVLNLGAAIGVRGHLSYFLEV